MKYCFCPKCNKQLIVLNIEEEDEYTYSNFWCDDCNVEVKIGEPNLKPKFFVEIQSKKDFDEIMLQSQLFDNSMEAKDWYNTIDWIDENYLTASIMACYVDNDGDIIGDIEFWEAL